MVGRTLTLRVTPGMTIALAAFALLLSSARAQDITLLGGNATIDDQTSKAYDQTLPTISDDASLLLHDLGQTGFLRDFGRVKLHGKIRLGPHFNAPSCASCHTGNGRGALRISARGRISDTVVKVSSASGRSDLPGGPRAVPGIGTQLRDHAIRRVSPQGKVSLSWAYLTGFYSDGRPYQLRVPRLHPLFGKIRPPSGTKFSLRRAPPVFGTGLLEGIAAADIVALADPHDLDRNGISGRPNYVWDVSKRTAVIGRFGFKAGNPSVRQQIAAAYATDMGVSNSLFHAGDPRPDIPDRILDATTFYTATLAVPRARLQNDPGVIRGKELFQSFQCSACHVMEMQSSVGAAPGSARNTIHPFTDLLLHDMGSGLADERPEFLASGAEWRTTPLWGIGLTGTVLAPRNESFLHDGRARTLEEAILWHGGEAAVSQQRFVSASQHDREDLIRFLRSL